MLRAAMILVSLVLAGCTGANVVSSEAPELPARGGGSIDSYELSCWFTSSREASGQEREYRGEAQHDTVDGQTAPPPKGRVVVDVGDEDWLRLTVSAAVPSDQITPSRIWVEVDDRLQVVEGVLEADGPFEPGQVSLEFRVKAVEAGHVAVRGMIQGTSRDADATGECAYLDYTVQIPP